MADLKFTIATGTIHGQLSDDLKIHIIGAVSGGRGGSVINVYKKDKTGQIINGKNKKPIVIGKADNLLAQDSCLINNPFYTHFKHENDEDKTGGSIPEGRYIMTPKFATESNQFKKDEDGNLVINSTGKYKVWVVLMPLSGNTIVNTINNREGLAIHGRGSQGSAGCIVVPGGNGFNQLKRLYDHLVKLSRTIGSDFHRYPTLEVQAGFGYVLKNAPYLMTCKPKNINRLYQNQN